MSNNSKVDLLKNYRTASRQGGGPDRIEAQHKRGKLTARERLEILMDKGSFREVDAFVVHRTNDFGLEEQRINSDRISRYLAARWVKSMQRKSSRLWKWP
jgi:propionyl-CoA carboxylase beta chain